MVRIRGNMGGIMPRLEHKQNIALMIDFVSHLMNNYHNMILDQYKITTKQAKVLAYLMHHQGEDILQKNIEEVFFLRSSTVTSVMQNLEKAGFIERYTNKNDRRMKRIIITRKGYETFENCEKALVELNNTILADWTEEEKKEILVLLDKIALMIKSKKQC